MVTSASSAQPLYDHERPRRRPAPDWGGDAVFDAVPRRRFAPSQPPEPKVEPVQAAPVARPAPRPRPRPRTVEQRIHARPDRLAAWAFALGLLLIVIAIATSS